MAVETNFHSFDDDQIYPQKTVLPGEVHCWKDRSALFIRFIIVHCMKDNFGAVVHVVNEYDIEDYADESETLHIKLDQDSVIEHILPGFGFEIEVVDDDEDRGNLTFQHLLPDGTTQSYN